MKYFHNHTIDMEEKKSIYIGGCYRLSTSIDNSLQKFI